MAEDAACPWTEDFDGNWSTTCGEMFCFTDGGPVENGMKFCCYCGLTLKAEQYTDPDPEDDLTA